MAEFKKAVPASLGELKTYLEKLYDNRTHVKGVKVNPNTNHLEVDLDWMANAAGYPDVYMPIRRGKVNEAKALIERMVSQIGSGFMPSDTDARALFDLIDQAG